MTRKTAAGLGAAALLAAGCGAAGTAVHPTASASASATPVASADAKQVRVDAFAYVAERLYKEEASGNSGRRNAARIAKDPQLLRALESGSQAAIRAAALHQLFLPVKHVVRIRVVRGGRTLVDVGGAFVAGQESRPLVAPNGSSLGRLDVSMQDMLGLTKLEKRFTGAGIVVHGRGGHVVASVPQLTHATIPDSGPVQIAGKSYIARSFTRTGFGGEPLRISVVIPG
jgi:hypothetical protein